MSQGRNPYDPVKVREAILQTLQSGEEWFVRGVLRRLCDTGLSREEAKLALAAYTEAILQRERS
jgi:hypothetical protein